MKRVNVATSIGRSGLQDWLLQRITAVILVLYICFWGIYAISTPVFEYATWKNVFSSETMRFSTIIALLCLLIHSWIGIWTVTTDYVKNLSLRLCLQTAFAIGLLLCLLWGFKILWSI